MDIVKQWIGKLRVYAAKNAPGQQRSLTIILICLEKIRHFHASLNIFQSICLGPFVLQVAWLSYKQHYENVYDGLTHTKYRNVSYRQYVRWTHGYVGKQIRAVIPSCVSVVSGHIFLHLGKKNISNLSVSDIWISSRQPFNPKIKICLQYRSVSKVMCSMAKVKSSGL